MSTALESNIRIQQEDFVVTDEIEAIKKASRNIGGIVTFLGTGRELSKGENIVLIVAAGEHRKEAFHACEWAITELKRITPIWKRETTSTGEVWVQDTP